MLTLDIELLEEVFGDSFDPVTVSPQQLRQAIRGLTVSSLAVPVLCGSSFRNIGVQPLLSAIAHYLPSPLDTTVDVLVVDPRSMYDLRPVLPSPLVLLLCIVCMPMHSR